MYYYVLLQLVVWWFCHIAVLFWKVIFPFHSNKPHHIKYIHVGIVVLAILVPFVPVAVSLATGGFIIKSFPPLLCVPRRVEVTFYTLALPISILMAVGIVMLLAVLWTIRKVSDLTVLEFIKFLYMITARNRKTVKIRKTTVPWASRKESDHSVLVLHCSCICGTGSIYLRRQKSR